MNTRTTLLASAMGLCVSLGAHTSHAAVVTGWTLTDFDADGLRSDFNFVAAPSGNSANTFGAGNESCVGSPCADIAFDAGPIGVNVFTTGFNFGGAGDFQPFIFGNLSATIDEALAASGNGQALQFTALDWGGIYQGNLTFPMSPDHLRNCTGEPAGAFGDTCGGTAINDFTALSNPQGYHVDITDRGNGDYGVVIRFVSTIQTGTSYDGNEANWRLEGIMHTNGYVPPSRIGTPLVRCTGDINANGSMDIAMINDQGEVRIRDTNGSLISEFTFAGGGLTDALLIPDANGNSTVELVGLSTHAAQVMDTVTGESLSAHELDAARELALLDDQNGNGVSELAILAGQSTRIMDAISADLLNTISHNRLYSVSGLQVFPDLDGNGVQALGILANHGDPTKSDKLEIKDTLNPGGTAVQNFWLGSNWDHLDQTLIADQNGNGYPEIAILRKKPDDSVISVRLNDSQTREGFGALYFDRSLRELRLLPLADINGNGADELLVFGRRANGAQKAQIKDSRSKSNIRSVFFDKNFPAQDIQACGDMNGNGSQELVLLGMRRTDGKLKVIIKDSLTGELIGTVNF